jgi:hypothetical protein
MEDEDSNWNCEYPKKESNNTFMLIGVILVFITPLIIIFCFQFINSGSDSIIYSLFFGVPAIIIGISLIIFSEYMKTHCEQDGNPNTTKIISFYDDDSENDDEKTFLVSTEDD